MSRIQKLPEQLVRRIAAGEVIERPASVLKELLENSLDAGARNVTVEWVQAGRKKIRITDDGRGIPADEVALALERHATSKISSLDDLEKIRTFGFRGEALPSIAAVSRFKIVTRAKGAKEGHSVEVEGGSVLREGPCGAPEGTTITVEDLFFCTPAREKFLKSDTTEKSQLLRTVEDVALAARGVNFHVISDGKEVLTLRAPREGAEPAEALLERLKAAWGADRLDAVKSVLADGRFLKVWGWVSDIHAHEGSARHQRLFINNRAVLNRRVTHAVYEAYRGSLMVGRHPMAVLFLDVDPAFVDVNVHPSKREVRLSHEEEVYGFVLRSVQTALTSSARMPTAFGGASGGDSDRRGSVGERRGAPPPLEAGRTGFIRRGFLPPGVPSAPTPVETQAALDVQAPLKRDEAGGAEPAELQDFRRFEPVALMQLDGTYILARMRERFFIFDQHAAAERVLYERLSDAAKDRLPNRQALLLPWVWEVSAQTAAVVNEHLADFAKLGYELEAFGGQSFRVKAVPGALGDSSKVRTLLEGLAEDLLTEAIPKNWDAIVVRAACRGSVKANDPLKPAEMEQILKDLQKCRMPWCCPHGRPTYLRLAGDELAKRFKRV